MNKREYAQLNKAWIEAKAQEEGVKALPRGIYYKVLSEGRNDGRHPSPCSIVMAHYTGWIIDGKKFDSCLGGSPLAIRLCDLIEGWIVAIQQMCVGDKWGVYPCGNGIWQVLTTGHPRRLYADIRLKELQGEMWELLKQEEENRKELLKLFKGLGYEI